MIPKEYGGILAGMKNRVLEMDIPETGKCNLASKCSQDCEKSASGAPSCGGLVPGAWVLLHDTSDSCCCAHVSYDVASCKSL